MKHILAVLSLAAFSTLAFAGNDPYRTNAGESESDNAVQIQLGDAGSWQEKHESDSFSAPQLG